ncbi:unnamed protein product [Closterium sp. NIES-54]
MTPTSENDTSLSSCPLLPAEESASFAEVDDLVDCFSLRDWFLPQRGRRLPDFSRPPLASSSESLRSGHSKERWSGSPHSQHSRRRLPPPRMLSLADFFLSVSLIGFHPLLPPPPDCPRCPGRPPCFIGVTWFACATSSEGRSASCIASSCRMYEWPASRYSLHDFKAICTHDEQHREMTVKVSNCTARNSPPRRTSPRPPFSSSRPLSTHGSPCGILTATPSAPPPPTAEAGVSEKKRRLQFCSFSRRPTPRPCHLPPTAVAAGGETTGDGRDKGAGGIACGWCWRLCYGSVAAGGVSAGGVAAGGVAASVVSAGGGDAGGDTAGMVSAGGVAAGGVVVGIPPPLPSPFLSPPPQRSAATPFPSSLSSPQRPPLHTQTVAMEGVRGRTRWWAAGGGAGGGVGAGGSAGGSAGGRRWRVRRRRAREIIGVLAGESVGRFVGGSVDGFIIRSVGGFVDTFVGGFIGGAIDGLVGGSVGVLVMGRACHGEDIRSTNKQGGDRDPVRRKLEVAIARCNPACCHVARRHRRQTASLSSNVALRGACSRRRPHPSRLNAADLIGVYHTSLPRRASRIATDLVTTGIDSHVDAALVVHRSRRSRSSRVFFRPHQADACHDDRQWSNGPTGDWRSGITGLPEAHLRTTGTASNTTATSTQPPSTAAPPIHTPPAAPLADAVLTPAPKPAAAATAAVAAARGGAAAAAAAAAVAESGTMPLLHPLRLAGQ